ncbi:hypothetical protein [Mycolicibacterium neworleansense]|uniref:Uncharacterized protein n=1 Tax=Mycolicibacterium neworleansense TaxID=146018 RepID=A0A0H5RLQ6_9MYCO|nr:hypothetical protein [Mycolicibacterium neworleansense]MCV7360876.1 hypothetical protein [Mycolicibacterium neworleansense]CRZ14402.1 hypothetical protein BN2156_01251 [Mycolicibacterium neworleansense]
MAGIGTEDVPGQWLTAAEVARASQLREDLVERFLPAAQPQENLYGRDLVSVARFVKSLTDLGTPTAAVEMAVAELRARPDAAFNVALRGAGGGSRWPVSSGLTKKSRARTVIGVTTAAALLVGGVVAVTLSRHEAEPAAVGPAPSSAAKPVPAEVVASVTDDPGTKPSQAFAAAKPDPVCAQWQRASSGFDGKQQAWAKTDHRVPAARWSPKQRSVTLAVIPVMRQEAAELRRLADKSMDPLLTGMLRAQSRYIDNYAAKLPKFEPPDHASWTAATAIDGAVKAVCSTPR